MLYFPNRLIIQPFAEGLAGISLKI